MIEAINGYIPKKVKTPLTKPFLFSTLTTLLQDVSKKLTIWKWAATVHLYPPDTPKTDRYLWQK
jgi:hypothetical protein